MNSDSFETMLKNHLTMHGYEEEEIARVLERVAEFDRTTFRDSVFDSIGRGTFNLRDFVNETLKEAGPNIDPENA